MTGDTRTTFQKIGRWELAGGGDELPPTMTIVEQIDERPRSREVLAECAAANCGFSGPAEEYDNRNTYWICPACGSEAMIPRGR